ncbi:polyprenyl synthetase family protein [Clostridium oryzae]|uniref:polyprenyl synthetase family protein n=1 Tax=Clostridium oryzae TaxID=1450648 RepID=UPI001A9A41ED|nr:farnesyl diphosphate synthase [Clostridium oryzae]
MDEYKDKVDEWLKQYFVGKGSYDKIVYEAMSYSLNAGGKRIRPALMFAAYSIYCDNYECIMEPACALEMIHTYSLIHDDLPCMDDDDLRRGKPTCHKKFSYPLAVLAGDGLLNEAMNVLFSYSLANGEKALKASQLIAKCSGADGMLGGQVVDIISEGKSIDYDQLRYMHSKKTGALIKAAVVCGGLLADASEEHINMLSEYADKLGLAFQIKDDILDEIGNAEELGKNVKKDAGKNKTTYVSMLSLEECQKLLEDLTKQCKDILTVLDGNTEFLMDLTDFLLYRKY